MRKRGLRKHGFLWGAVFFFILIALVIQIAVLSYDFIIQKTENNFLIGVLLLIDILILSFVCTTVDVIRRKFMVEKPVEKILKATDKIAKGDFSARLQPDHEYGKYTGYDLIIENINTLAAELEKTEVLKTDFISNVSHELKTPLTVIQNYSQLLQKEDLDEESRKKYAKILSQAAKRFSDLITNILKLNKLENQKIQPEYQRFDLTALVAECVVAYEELLENKKIELVCDLDEVMAYSVPSLLELIWNNLLSNAAKFTNEGGRVEITLKKQGKNAVVSVSDTGCGISPETGARIFEKFYQGDTSHSQEGNGLGLALVKKVVDVLGGEISVHSELGKGSRFEVTLKDVCDV
ncbi:MAG: HAMP domain-containing histidine kinase [Clostridia bacterium]|nr:HAMP domain-containing histidine kinase [Clostridia bacterium]